MTHACQGGGVLLKNLCTFNTAATTLSDMQQLDLFRKLWFILIAYPLLRCVTLSLGGSKHKGLEELKVRDSSRTPTLQPFCQLIQFPQSHSDTSSLHRKHACLSM